MVEVFLIDIVCSVPVLANICRFVLLIVVGLLVVVTLLMTSISAVLGVLV